MTDEQKTFSIAGFELRKKFQEAMTHGRYLVTITKYMGSGQMEHFTSYEDFPTDSILPAMQHLGNELLKGLYRPISDAVSGSSEKKTVTPIKKEPQEQKPDGEKDDPA